MVAECEVITVIIIYVSGPVQKCTENTDKL